MDARPKSKLKPVGDMTTDELLHELLYSNDEEQVKRNKQQMAKYLGKYAALYGS